MGVDLRTRVKKLGAKKQARSKKCKLRFSNINKNQSLPEKLHESGGQEVVTGGHGASKDLVSSCSSHGKVKTEETGGSSSGQKEYDLPVFVHGSASGLEIEEELSTLATQNWAEGVWTGNMVSRHKEKLG